MRLFEIIIAGIMAMRILLPYFPSLTPRRDASLSLISLLILILHLGLERYRWQMIPIYILVILISVHSIQAFIRNPKSSKPESKPKVIATLFFGLFLLLAIMLPILMPVPSTPKPTGSYGIGSTQLWLKDASRLELYSQNPGDFREIMVKIWYPAEIMGNANPGPWIENIDVFGPAIASVLGLPSFSLRHLELSSSYAYPGASVIVGTEKYPIVLFSHGWQGFHAQNTYQTEDLASHGYIVIAPDHTYGAAAAVFPDGRVALNNPNALPSHRDISEMDYKQAANQLVDQWAGDFSFIIDYLSAVSPNNMPINLIEQMDFDRIGIMGHSTGGGAAIEFCAQDSRCKAGLTMDAYLTPVSESLLEGGLSQPFLYLFSETWSSGINTQMFKQLYDNHSGPAYFATISGTAHFDFSDLPAFSPLAPYIGLKGPLDGNRTLAIIRDFTISFYDQQFLGTTAPLLDGTLLDYPEVDFHRKK